MGDLTAVERARAFFQAGTLLEKAQQYGRAIEYYYRSEIAASIGELEPQINSHIKNCFERLGKFSALRYEMMDRTSIDGQDSAGSKLVAEIGAEKITEADLDAIIEGAIDNQLSPMSAFMAAQELNEQKKKMLGQFKSPQAKQQFLQSWLAQEILYRQALEQGLTQKPEVKKSLDDLTRGVLSQQLMNQELASKIHLTETDVQTYYTANKEQYIEPANANISHILVETEQQARDLIEKIKGGDDFAELAKQFSKDDGTKDQGGKISIQVTKGSNVPVVGKHGELNEKIFAAKAPEVLAEPFKTEKGWEIIRVERISSERQKSFDEVRQEAMSALLGQKRQDVQQQYIKEMMDKYNVIMHSSAFSGNEQAPADGGNQKQ
ncbi:MAG: peptidylprolyl isomerase [Planctomycetota bacterium]